MLAGRSEPPHLLFSTVSSLVSELIQVYQGNLILINWSTFLQSMNDAFSVSVVSALDKTQYFILEIISSYDLTKYSLRVYDSF